MKVFNNNNKKYKNINNNNHNHDHNHNHNKNHHHHNHKHNNFIYLCSALQPLRSVPFRHTVFDTFFCMYGTIFNHSVFLFFVLVLSSPDRKNKNKPVKKNGKYRLFYPQAVL